MLTANRIVLLGCAKRRATRRPRRAVFTGPRSGMLARRRRFPDVAAGRIFFDNVTVYEERVLRDSDLYFRPRMD
jgi:hypothetical protein